MPFPWYGRSGAPVRQGGTTQPGRFCVSPDYAKLYYSKLKLLHKLPRGANLLFTATAFFRLLCFVRFVFGFLVKVVQRALFGWRNFLNYLTLSWRSVLKCWYANFEGWYTWGIKKTQRKRFLN